jgi:hypothetical protein
MLTFFFEEPSMQLERFPTREDAESLLRTLGYVFMGAPGRWRRLTVSNSFYAEVSAKGGLWFVVFRDGRSA